VVALVAEAAVFFGAGAALTAVVAFRGGILCGGCDLVERVREEKRKRNYDGWKELLRRKR